MGQELICRNIKPAFGMLELGREIVVSFIQNVPFTFCSELLEVMDYVEENK